MSHRVLMLGGKRAGKSSLLASILYTLKYEGPSSFHCEDKTLYQAGIQDLEKKRKELETYIRRFRIIGGESLFLVDAGETIERGVYTLRSTIGNAFLDLDFIDVPGEWMTANSEGHSDLLEEVKRTDVFLIAIDTPMLMEAPGYLSKKYNRIKAIQSVLDDGNLLNDGEKKLIVFCPIKCEKWVQQGRTNDVINKIRTAYADIINTWMVPEIDILIIPVQTAGGIEFAKQLPGKMIRRNQYTSVEEFCSVDETSRRYLMPDGFFLEFHPNIAIREDAVRNEYPLSWFRVNSKGYRPKSCEAVTFSIIRFLVNKEIDYCSQQKKDKKWWQIWKPPFGKYLTSFQNFIQSVEVDGEYNVFKQDHVL